MKYVAVLLVGGGVYLCLAHGFLRNNQVPPPAAIAPQQSAQSSPGTDFLKRPLDRTEEVLRQARERAADQP
jgi:hypothetical protein